MPGRSNNCSSFEITARLPIQLQRERDTWSASTTGKIWQPLCFAAQRPNCQDTSHRPAAGPASALVRFALQRRPTGPWLQGRGFMIPRKLRVRRKTQKMLNRRINSWRASIACAGFIRLRIFSRRSRSIAASSRTSRLRAFHFAYLPAPIPNASSAETTQTVMSVEVTRSIKAKKPFGKRSPFTTKFKRHAGSAGAHAEKLRKECPARRVTQRARRPRSPAIHREPVS